MSLVNPIIYKYMCTTATNLITLPLDITQTKILNTDTTNINVDEIKWLLLFPLIFTSQNIIYNNLSFIKSNALRGAITGIISTPVYIFLETRKLYSRINDYPRLLIYTRWIILRQVLFYSILYKISNLNIYYSKFLSALVANTAGFPIKIIALKNSYNSFIINKKTFRLTAMIEILKSSISDGLALYLLYLPN
jgi:hypothetical protein